MDDVEVKKVARDEQDSLAPVRLDRVSVEDEAVLMQRGRAGKMMAVAMAAILLGAGANYWMKRIDAREAYVGASASVHRLRVDKLEPFLRCALPDIDRAQVNSKDRLISAIESYGDRMGKDYGRVLARCTPMLSALPAQLAAVQAPASLQPEVRGLSTAARDLTQAVDNYRSYLSNSGSQYDYVQALPMMEKIAVAWERYEAHQASFDSAVHEAVL